jgi:hypothetical protein
LALPVVAASSAGEPASRPGVGKKVPITVSRETTLLLGPLNDDGTVDYVAAANEMLGKGVTAGNNAAIPLIQAVGPKILPELEREELLKRLGIAPLPDKGQYYVSPSDYIDAERPDANSADQEKLLGKPWDVPKRGLLSEADNPLLGGWLKRNARPLSLAVAASKRTRFYIPLTSSHRPARMQDIVSWPHSKPPSELATALACRAMLEAGRGRFDSALADLVAARRLAALITHGGLLIDRLVAVGVDRLVLEGFTSLAGSGKLDARQARQLLAALEAGPLPPDSSDPARQVEFLFALDWITRIGREGLDGGAFEPWTPEDKVPIPPVDLDMDEMLRLTQRDWRQALAADAMPTYAQRAEARRRTQQVLDPNVAAVAKKYPNLLTGRRRLRALVEKLASAGRKERTLAVQEALSKAGGISAENLGALIEGGQARFDIARLVCALAAFRLETGRYPALLSELAPKYVPVVPKDVFSDKPLVYKRTAKGYLLYSVGPNMRDDGGEYDSPSGKDDIAARAPM